MEPAGLDAGNPSLSRINSPEYNTTVVTVVRDFQPEDFDALWRMGLIEVDGAGSIDDRARGVENLEHSLERDERGHARRNR